MTVGDIIVGVNQEKRAKRLATMRARLVKLRALRAPQIILDNIELEISSVETLRHIRNFDGFAALDVTDSWLEAHASGLVYWRFETGDGQSLKFYEFTRYGSYVTWVE